MSEIEKVRAIKKDYERTIQGLVTKQNEFTYDFTGGRVGAGQTYSTYFTEEKREVYITGILSTTNSKIINKVNDDSLINKYNDLNKQTKQSYPINKIATPTNTDYKTGIIPRYFTRKANDLNAKFFEISEEDFSNENPLFEYFSISWVITGRKDEVERENKNTLVTLPNSLQKLLFPLQLWRPTKNSRDEVEKKLERLVR